MGTDDLSGRQPEEVPTIWDLLADDNWTRVLISLKHSEVPENEHLATALRGPHPMPGKVRAFLADYFSGRIKKARGRPSSIHKKMSRFEKRDYHVLMTYIRVIDEMRAQDKSGRPGTPSEEAFVKVAESVRAQRIHIAPDQVRAIVYRKGGGIQRWRHSS